MEYDIADIVGDIELWRIIGLLRGDRQRSTLTAAIIPLLLPRRGGLRVLVSWL